MTDVLGVAGGYDRDGWVTHFSGRMGDAAEANLGRMATEVRRRRDELKPLS